MKLVKMFNIGSRPTPTIISAPYPWNKMQKLIIVQNSGIRGTWNFTRRKILRILTKEISLKKDLVDFFFDFLFHSRSYQFALILDWSSRLRDLQPIRSSLARISLVLVLWGECTYFVYHLPIKIFLDHLDLSARSWTVHTNIMSFDDKKFHQ